MEGNFFCLAFFLFPLYRVEVFWALASKKFIHQLLGVLFGVPLSPFAICI
jgi:hypothetical protein